VSADGAAAPPSGGDRSLLYIGLGIAALVLVAASVVLLLGSRAATTFEADTPEGVVQRHLAAYEDGDYDAAWAAFSSEVRAMMPLDEYRRAARDFGSYSDLGSRRILFDATELEGDRARVSLTVEEYYESGPFGGGDMFRSSREIALVREAGEWRIDDALIGLEPGPFEPF
jgi:hypothetical protein